MGRLYGLLITTLATIFLLCQTMEAGVIPAPSSDARFNQLQQGSPEGLIQKRPFCNAFTGCGRKRSYNPSGSHQPNDLGLNADNTIGALLDLNSEPAVEDLVRQIMSEAKLWEAIQEANHEMISEKLQQSGHNGGRLPIAFSTQ